MTNIGFSFEALDEEPTSPFVWNLRNLGRELKIVKNNGSAFVERTDYLQG